MFLYFLSLLKKNTHGYPISALPTTLLLTCQSSNYGLTIPSKAGMLDFECIYNIPVVVDIVVANLLDIDRVFFLQRCIKTDRRLVSTNLFELRNPLHIQTEICKYEIILSLFLYYLYIITNLCKKVNQHFKIFYLLYLKLKLLF